MGLGAQLHAKVQKSWLRLPALLKSCPSSAQVPATLSSVSCRNTIFPWHSRHLTCSPPAMPGSPGLSATLPCVLNSTLSGTLTQLSTCWFRTLIILFKVATACQGGDADRGRDILGSLGWTVHVATFQPLWIASKVPLYSSLCYVVGWETGLGR